MSYFVYEFVHKDVNYEKLSDHEYGLIPKNKNTCLNNIWNLFSLITNIDTEYFSNNIINHKNYYYNIRNYAYLTIIIDLKLISDDINEVVISRIYLLGNLKKYNFNILNTYTKPSSHTLIELHILEKCTGYLADIAFRKE